MCLISQAEVAPQLVNKTPRICAELLVTTASIDRVSSFLPRRTLIQIRAEQERSACLLGQPFPKYAGGRLISAKLIQLKIALNQTSGKPCAPRPL